MSEKASRGATGRVVALLRAGELQEATSFVELTLRTSDTEPDHWRAAGLVYAWQHDWGRAQDAFQKALDSQQPNVIWWRDVGLALIGARAPAQACQVFERILADNTLPPDSETHLRYGEALELLGQDKPAYAMFAQAVEGEDTLTAFEGLARTACKLYRDEEALRYAREVARRRCYDPRALHMLADAQYQVGCLPTALRTFRRAMKSDPSSSEVYAGYLFACMHSPAHGALALKRDHENWFARHGAAPIQHLFTNDRDTRRPLRIGYLSSEFHVSPTQFFLLPLLNAHDRMQFSSYCYNFSRAQDAVTGLYKAAATHWRDLPGADAGQIRDAILEDRIDILVDASGLFYPKVAPLLQMRSAPVQVLLPVYACTTGCREVDYVITDRWTTPENAGFEAHYSERTIFRVPSGFVLYGSAADSPPISELPALQHGCVTFGLFQRPSKLNDHVWAAIAEILNRTPRSRLLIHHASVDLDEPGSAVRRRMASKLAKHGITADRLQFVGRRSLVEHLETVARVDIALDTFPYSGHTTTCDALWMGVPVVSFAGRTHASRVSAGLLARGGLPEWATDSVEGYIAHAVAATKDLHALGALRRELRSRMAQSSICRHEIVVREIEAGYRAMWQQWCKESALSAAVAL